MLAAPCDFRMVLADLKDDDNRVEFLLTQRLANVNRTMREKGVPCLAIDEFAAYIKVSGIARDHGEEGMNLDSLRRVLKARYAGRVLDLMPARIHFDPEDACRSSSTSSDDADPAAPDASTSTETSPSTPAEVASGTPG